MMDGMQPVADRLADKVERIEVIDVVPGDTVLLYPLPGLATGDLREIQRLAAKIWPTNKVVVVAGLDHIEVQRPASYGYDPVF